MVLDIKENISLAQYTTLHVGGVADYFVEVSTVEELRTTLLYAKEHSATPPLILGGGSNLLISDDGYRGLVIKNNLLDRIYEESNADTILKCGSGEILDEVIAETVEKGLWGLENLSSIPGTVGATPIQNVGAYGVEVSDLVTEVTAVHFETTEERIFTLEECNFSYRDSFFKTEEGRNWIVTSVSFRLSKESKPVLEYGDLVNLKNEQNITPANVRVLVQEIRAGKFPDWNVIGTAGSFFKNPIVSQDKFQSLKSIYPGLPGFETEDGRVKLSLGWILDKVCNLRGYCEGGVCLYKNQALVLTNTGDSEEAISNFQAMVVKTVADKLSINIEPEVTFIG